MTFGEKIRELRKDRGLTQKEVSVQTKISLRTLINYENGTTYPKNKDAYVVLGKFFGVSSKSLHDDTDDFIADAQEKYGYRGRKQADAIINEMTGLFAGGELSEEDKDTVMQAIQDAYWDAKKTNQMKYGKK